MELIYLALLLHKLGKSVTEENIKKVLSAVGVQADEAKVKVLVASLKDVDIDKELESASLMTVAPQATIEEKKEEKKEEKVSEAAEGLASLFA